MKKLFWIVLILAAVVVVAFTFMPKGDAPGIVQYFENPFELEIGEVGRLPDGLTVQLVEINDSRCKPDVQCVWEGEFSARLGVSGRTPEPFSSELRLGTVNNRIVRMQEYVFTLQSATENRIVLVIAPEGNRKAELERAAVKTTD